MSREQETDATNTVNRRRLLQALGVGTGGVVVASPAAATDKRLVVKQPEGCRGMVEYSVCVTGTVEKHENTDKRDEITNDGTCATGTMGPESGNDIFTYTGAIESVDISGPAAIYANDELIHAPDCMDQETSTGGEESREDDFCPLDNEVRISGVPGATAPVTVELEVANGVIELPSGERRQSCRVEMNAKHARRTGWSASYSGQLVGSRVDGPARLTIDQPAPCDR